MSRGQSLVTLGQWSRPQRSASWTVTASTPSTLCCRLSFRSTPPDRPRAGQGGPWLDGVPGRDERAPRCSSYVFILLG